jgi:hypothetical protein
MVLLGLGFTKMDLLTLALHPVAKTLFNPVMTGCVGFALVVVGKGLLMA